VGEVAPGNTSFRGPQYEAAGVRPVVAEIVQQLGVRAG
jgi:hypothetical protein